jgi:hypothetical protein
MPTGERAGFGVSDVDVRYTVATKETSRERRMIILLNIGRLMMVAWVIYGLLLIFAPSVVHKPPDQWSGIIQVVIAYSLGYLMDRALGLVRRRRAEEAAVDGAS